MQTPSITLKCSEGSRVVVGAPGAPALVMGAGAGGLESRLDARLAAGACALAGEDLETRISRIGDKPGVRAVTNALIAPASVSVARAVAPAPPAMGGTGSAGMDPRGVAVWSLAAARSVRTHSGFTVDPATGTVSVPSLRMPDGSLLRPRVGPGGAALAYASAGGAVVNSFGAEILRGSRPAVALRNDPASGAVLWSVADPNGDAEHVYLWFRAFSPPSPPSAGAVAANALAEHKERLPLGRTDPGGSFPRPPGTFYVAAVASDAFGFSPVVELTIA